MATREIAKKRAQESLRAKKAMAKGGAAAEQPKVQEAAAYQGKMLAEQVMRNRELMHNFRMSPSKTNIVHPSIEKESMVVIDRQGKEYELKGLPLSEDLMFSPDGKKLAYLALLAHTSPAWVGIKLCDVKQGAEPRVIYKTQNVLRGLEWSPKGDALYFMESEKLPNGEEVMYLKRIGVSGVGALIIAKSYSFIDFFQPPVSRFEHGQGNSSRPYRVLYGTFEGLFVVNSDGKGKERVTDIPASGVDNLEWCPTKEMVAVAYKVPRISGQKLYRGIVLFRRGEEAWEAEGLYPGYDVHTLWWSANGRYCCFATPTKVYVYDLETEDPDARLIEVEIPPAPPPEGDDEGEGGNENAEPTPTPAPAPEPAPPPEKSDEGAGDEQSPENPNGEQDGEGEKPAPGSEGGAPAPAPAPARKRAPERTVRGFYWHKKSDRMVIAAGNCIFEWRPDEAWRGGDDETEMEGEDGVMLYRAARGVLELIHEEGDPYKTFMADCYYLDDGNIVYTAYTDRK